MNENLSFLLADISSFWGIIPSILAILLWNRAIKEQRFLAILVWIGTGVGLMAFILGYFFGASNLYLLHIYTLLEMIFLNLIFQAYIGKEWSRRILIAFLLFATIISVTEQFNSFNVLNRSVSALLIMFYTLRFFLVNLKELKIDRMEKEPLFWISIGALFYNAASFFIFLFSSNLEPFEELWFSYFGIHSVFTILLYTFYTIALWVSPERNSIYQSK